MDDMFADDMSSARRRAERAITEDGFLDIKSVRLPRPLIADHFEDEVSIVNLPFIAAAAKRVKPQQLCTLFRLVPSPVDTRGMRLCEFSPARIERVAKGGGK